MKNKVIIVIATVVLFCSCKSATERWLDKMAEFKEMNTKSLTIQVMKVKPSYTDTESFSYSVRIYPSKTWMEGKAGNQPEHFFYGTDSCFQIKSGIQSFSPAIVQPVNNGIANCYEYLLSFNINKAIKQKNVELIYADKFFDGKKYAIQLN